MYKENTNKEYKKDLVNLTTEFKNVSFPHLLPTFLVTLYGGPSKNAF